jgi:hypothetical protein
MKYEEIYTRSIEPEAFGQHSHEIEWYSKPETFVER